MGSYVSTSGLHSKRINIDNNNVVDDVDDTGGDDDDANDEDGDDDGNDGDADSNYQQWIKGEEFFSPFRSPD